jgi:tryptophan synthase alpha chain
MQANDTALAGGMTTAGSFELIKKARQAGVDCDMYVMSYIQKVQHFGLEEFCAAAADAGVRGLIIPDLPYDSQEFEALTALAAKHNLEIVPVLSPGMVEARLKALLSLQPPVVYVTSQQGITGNQYAGGHQLKELVADIRDLSSAKIMIGFGIATAKDVADVLSTGDVAVVGSSIIKILQAANINEVLKHVADLVQGRGV